VESEKDYDVRGPTAERILKSGGDFVEGGDERTRTKIYQFKDTPVDRFYKRLAAADKSDETQEELLAEHRALIKYREHWHRAGLEPSVHSVDLNRIYSADPFNSSGMARSESQAFHRQMYRRAIAVIGHEAGVLLDNFVCYEWPPRIASAMSPYRFRKAIRRAANMLSEQWGIK
jgi:hypothetical protein